MPPEAGRTAVLKFFLPQTTTPIGFLPAHPQTGIHIWTETIHHYTIMPVHPKQYAARGRSYSGVKHSSSLKPPLLLVFYQHIHKRGSIFGQQGSIITRLCRSTQNNMPPEAGRTAVLKILSPSNHHSYWFSTSTSTNWDRYLDSKDPSLHDYAGPPKTICRQRPVVQHRREIFFWRTVQYHCSPKMLQCMKFFWSEKFFLLVAGNFCKSRDQ